MSMRKRGTTIPDLILLIISINDSISNQTIESINHIFDSNLLSKTIVVITKIDLINNTEKRNDALNRIITDLSNKNIFVEQIGGDTQFIPISSYTNEGIQDLKDSIIALASLYESERFITKNENNNAYILETGISKKNGQFATIITKNNIIKNGNILLGKKSGSYCKVKAILNPNDNSIFLNNIIPSKVGRVLGWKDKPLAGEPLTFCINESQAKKLSKQILKLKNTPATTPTTTTTNSSIQLTNFIVKADTAGSIEAINNSILNIGNDQIKPNIVSSSIGIPTQSDFNLANLSNSTILCFNIPKTSYSLPKSPHSITIKHYDVIYTLLDDITQSLIDKLPKKFEKIITSTSIIRKIFDYKDKSTKKIIKVAGCKIQNGKININSNITITDKSTGNIIYDGKIKSLKNGKDDIKESGKGNECGIIFDNNFDTFNEGDIIESYQLDEIPITSL